MQQLIRPSRIRLNAQLRSLVRETRLLSQDLVMPLFFKEGKTSEPIASMPGIEKMGESRILKEVEKLEKSGIEAILLFGSSAKKDNRGSASYDEKSSYHQLIREIKKNFHMLLIADVCLCAYTDHGHCGILKNYSAEPGIKEKRTGDFIIENNQTLEALAETALSYARAGADVLAPSAMADGQVQAIREALDREGFFQTLIMSYSVKYASNFYGPFRDIYKSGPLFGDRRTYQMDPGNKDEALKEVELDIREGADMVMVKPALTCLDIIRTVKERALVPLAAYSVSGEYSMLKAAGQKGWLDEAACAMEVLNSIKRAGADIIITYWAKEAAEWLKRQE